MNEYMLWRKATKQQEKIITMVSESCTPNLIHYCTRIWVWEHFGMTLSSQYILLTFENTNSQTQHTVINKQTESIKNKQNNTEQSSNKQTQILQTNIFILHTTHWLSNVIPYQYVAGKLYVWLTALNLKPLLIID